MSVIFVKGNEEDINCGDPGVTEGTAWAICFHARSSVQGGIAYAENDPPSVYNNLCAIYITDVAISGNAGFRLYLRAAAVGGTVLDVNESYDDDVWRHFAIVQSAVDSRVAYVNAVSKDTDSTSVPVLATSVAHIAAMDNNGTKEQWGTLEMEDLRTFGRAPSVEEIALLAAGYHGPLGGEVQWLSLNEARGVSGGFDGASLANGTNLCPDLSVNSYDGDPTNTPIGAASQAPRYGVAV